MHLGKVGFIFGLPRSITLLICNIKANFGQLSSQTTMSTNQNTVFCRTRRFKEAEKHAYHYGES